jgi:hypothetical protein
VSDGILKGEKNMQTAKHIKNLSPPTPAKAKGETKENVPSADLKLSSETITFHDQEAGSEPCLSSLYALADIVPGCQNPLQAPFQQTSVDRVRESTRRFRESLMYTVPGAIREQAVDTLNLLIRFDKTVSMEESRVLMDAVKIITAKGLPA